MKLKKAVSLLLTHGDNFRELHYAKRQYFVADVNHWIIWVPSAKKKFKKHEMLRSKSQGSPMPISRKLKKMIEWCKTHSV